MISMRPSSRVKVKSPVSRAISTRLISFPEFCLEYPAPRHRVLGVQTAEDDPLLK